VSEILPENTRTVLRFRVDIDSRSVWFYGCHLKAGSDLASEERRRKEAERLAAYIVDHHDPATDPIVVLGDMNTANAGDFGDGGTLSFLTLTFDNPGNLENDFTAVNYLALPETSTFPAGDRVLDHIILSPGAFGFYLEGSVEIPAPEGTGAGVPGPSDHLPVTLDMARASL
jgi:endonuclease/exonuclease/phosphatase family metal-dependent hydrolase